jgi:hypothetical protein
MATFSQLVDAIVIETNRPDLTTIIASYLNQTIRECHFYPSNNAALLYRENLRELRLTSNVESGFTWAIPDEQLFQAMGAVKYESIYCRDDITRYPPEKVPGRGMVNLERFFYRAGNQYFFAGYGGLNGNIALAYYEYPRRLKYYVSGNRPALYDDDYGWTYAAPFVNTDELKLAGRNFTANWLLIRWSDVVAEGVRAKVYKRLADTERARTCFSLYTQLRMGLATSERMDSAGFA